MPVCAAAALFVVGVAGASADTSTSFPDRTGDAGSSVDITGLDVESAYGQLWLRVNVAGSYDRARPERPHGRRGVVGRHHRPRCRERLWTALAPSERGGLLRPGPGPGPESIVALDLDPEPGHRKRLLWDGGRVRVPGHRVRVCGAGLYRSNGWDFRTSRRTVWLGAGAETTISWSSMPGCQISGWHRMRGSTWSRWSRVRRRTPLLTSARSA